MINVQEIIENLIFLRETVRSRPSVIATLPLGQTITIALLPRQEEYWNIQYSTCSHLIRLITSTLYVRRLLYQINVRRKHAAAQCVIRQTMSGSLLALSPSMSLDMIPPRCLSIWLYSRIFLIYHIHEPQKVYQTLPFTIRSFQHIVKPCCEQS